MNNVILNSVMTAVVGRGAPALQRAMPARAAIGTMGGDPTYVEGAKGNTMSPGEIRACYRLYAAHRKSHEICAFPEAILANDVGTPAELAALRLHTGLEGLAREFGQCDPNDDLRCPAVVGHFGHFRKILASFAAQLFGRGVLMER